MGDQGQTILLIDDEQGLLVGLSAVLKRAGYQIITATNGSDGQKAAKEKKPDLIVCDIMMPAPNGFELRRLLSLDPATAVIPFIFLTARTGEADMLQGFNAGADDYVVKPFTREELIARIAAVLRRFELGKQKGKEDLDVHLVELRREITNHIGREFRTPLGVVLDTLELMLNDKFSNNLNEQRFFVREALENAERLDSLIEDLIMLSEFDNGRYQRIRQLIDLEQDFRVPIMKHVQKWRDRSIKSNIAVDSEVVIHAPKVGFQRVIIHLVDNACKFSPPGGEIDIKLQPRGVGGCIFSLRDEGCGIPVSLRDKVFDRYYQIKAEDCGSPGGLGIGLTISRAFARSLGGDITILDSNRGCRIQMIIPPGAIDAADVQLNGK